MRLAWALVAGALGAGALAWWLSRDEARPPPAHGAAANAASPASAAALYRWRDEAGVVQVTDVPPRDRPYTVVDVSALERRNVIDPDPQVGQAR